MACTLLVAITPGYARIGQYPAAPIRFRNLPVLVEYDRITAEVTRTTPLYFADKYAASTTGSGAMIEVGTQFVD
jgi:hypothetical protein